MTNAQEAQLAAIEAAIPEGRTIGGVELAITPILEAGAAVGAFPSRVGGEQSSVGLERSTFLSATAAVIEILHSARVRDFASFLLQPSDEQFTAELRELESEMRNPSHHGDHPLDDALPAYLAAWDWVQGPAPAFAKETLQSAFPESLFRENHRTRELGTAIFEVLLEATDQEGYGTFLDGIGSSQAWTEMLRHRRSSARGMAREFGISIEPLPPREWREMVELHRRIEELLSHTNALDELGVEFRDAARGPTAALNAQLRRSGPDPLIVQRSIFDLSRAIIAHSFNSPDPSVARLSDLTGLFSTLEVAGESQAQAAIRAVDAAAELIELSVSLPDASEETPPSVSGSDILNQLGWLTSPAVIGTATTIGVGAVVSAGGSPSLAIAAAMVSAVGSFWTARRERVRPPQ